MNKFQKTCFASLISVAMLAFPVVSSASHPLPAVSSPVVSAVVRHVNLNTADTKTLLAVQGITRTKARAIVAWRKKNGPFVSLADLRRVPGFKRMKMEVFASMTRALSVA